jgi:lipid A 3-O-deacylase
MNFRTILIGVFLVLCMAPSAVPAQEDADPNRIAYWSVHMENDLWGDGKDRHYTHGSKVSVAPAGDPPEWLRWLGGYVPFFAPGHEAGVEFSIGQSIFTPADIEDPNLIVSDRPYAGWLYASATLVGVLEEDPYHRVSNSLDFTMGVVGPSSGADEVQRRWHRIIDTRTPRGWDHQLSDEPGLVLTYTRVWEYFSQLGDKGPEVSLAPHGVAALGNVYTYAGAGAMMRLGYNLRSDLGPPAISPSFPGSAYFRSRSSWSAYLYAGVEGRLMAHNIFLDGNTFEDSHSVDRRVGVGDLQVGAAVRYRNVRLSFANVFRSKEFAGQPESTEYGAINLTFLY